MGDEHKQFDATPRKLEQARKVCQVVKSKDFSTAIALLIVFTAIYALCPLIWNQISKMFVQMYSQIPTQHLDNIGLSYIFTVAVVPTVLILGPILFVAWFVAIMADFIQVGPLVAMAPLSPKLDKLNPTKYFKNIMSVKTLFELLKNIAKVLILGWIGWSVYSEHLQDILKVAGIDNNFAVMIKFGEIIVEFVFKACIAFLVISGADYMVTKWKFLKDQKMSFKELKDEYKNTEGDPNVKAALRQRRQQMMQQGMMDAVPTADFIVTNPTHIACALKYDQEEMESPKLIAKGTELFAKKIIDIARQNAIPVVENPPVARALFRLVDVNREMPPDLYKAVAEILLFVYNLRNSQKPSNINTKTDKRK